MLGAPPGFFDLERPFDEHLRLHCLTLRQLHSAEVLHDRRQLGVIRAEGLLGDVDRTPISAASAPSLN
jgi:hypothetical protein